jgi:hypothetical protein
MLRGLLRSYEQSAEITEDSVLKTRYYKVMRDQALAQVREVVQKMPGYQFCFEIPNVGELVFMKRTVTGRIQDITITVTKVGALQTAVDIYSASRGSLGDLGSNYRVIRDIYAQLDRYFSTLGHH